MKHSKTFIANVLCSTDINLFVGNVYSKNTVHQRIINVRIILKFFGEREMGRKIEFQNIKTKDFSNSDLHEFKIKTDSKNLN